MLETIQTFFSGSFIPHGHCYLWKSGLVWLHVGSDAAIALAYTWIPLMLIYLIRQRRDIPFDWIFFLFGAFIVSCGLTHLMAIWTTWHPNYWSSGFVKFTCAAISLATAAAMVPLLPKALAIPSPAQLEAANLFLKNEIKQRIAAEETLRQQEQRLEQIVAERTASLETANEQLQRERTELERTKAELERAFNLSLDIIAIVGDDGYFKQASPAVAKILGYTPEEFISIKWLDYLHPDDRNISLAEAEKQLDTGEPTLHFENRYRTKDGNYKWLAWVSVPVTEERLMYAVARDITPIKQAQEALQESESRLRNQAEELENTLKQLKKAQSQLVQSEKMSSLEQVVAGIAHEVNNPVNFIYGNLTHALEYTQYLLELIQLYQQHYPNPEPDIEEKIEDIELEFLREDLPQLLASMKEGAERICKIVLSLRSFSRLDEAEMKAVNLHEGLDNTLMLLQNKLKAGSDRPEIQVIKEYGSLPPVECYPREINQVFINLIDNAIDALLGHGKLAIGNGESHAAQGESAMAHEESAMAPGALSAVGSADKEDKQEENAQVKIKDYAQCPIPATQPPPRRGWLPNAISPTIRIRTEAIADDWVAIRIADNSSGIPEEVKSKLFDPFFTTKPVGKGTGLGLSISYQIIVEQHGGRLQCWSEPGRGTEFAIEIPTRQPEAISD